MKRSTAAWATPLATDCATAGSASLTETFTSCVNGTTSVRVWARTSSVDQSIPATSAARSATLSPRAMSANVRRARSSPLAAVALVLVASVPRITVAVAVYVAPLGADT